MARRAATRPAAEYYCPEDRAMRDWVEDNDWYVRLGGPVELEVPVALDIPEIEGPNREVP
jgi:hypothetical protein